MAIRMTDTNEWDEDWFISMSGEYQHLWKFIKDSCDVAGVWKPNLAKFQALSKFSVSLGSFLTKVNGDKQRITVLGNGRWFIPGFIQFQYFNKQQDFELLLNNPLHKAIYQSLVTNVISLGAVRGLIAVCQPSMDKDKVKDKKKELVIEFDFKSKRLNEKYLEWLLWRKNEKKKPVSKKAAKMQVDFLAQFSEDEACRVIDQSISADWQGLFPLNDRKNGPGRVQTIAESIQGTFSAFADIQRDLDEAMRDGTADQGAEKG